MSVYKLAVYNIGSDVTATPLMRSSSDVTATPLIAARYNRHITDGLATEICDMVHDKCIDAVGICEVAHRCQRSRAIMDQVVWKLNSSSERRANSADSNAEPPAWKGQSDGHYVVVWNSQRLVLKAYEEIVYHYPSKIVKDLQFQQAEWPSGPSLHVYHDCSAVRPACAAGARCFEHSAHRVAHISLVHLITGR